MPNQKARILVSSTIIVVLSLSLLPPIYTQAQDSYYKRSFEWDYADHTYSWNLSIPENLYSAYQEVTDMTRTRRDVAGYGFLTTTEDPYVQSLAQSLNEFAQKDGFGGFEKVSLTLAFVQSLEYSSDNVTAGYDEYPRFPVETLVNSGGDCEDTSILFATLTLIMGYGTVYISPPQHVAVGVWGENLNGHYYTFEDRMYFYCETTGTGWKIGDMPEELQNGTAQIYPIDESLQYKANIVFEFYPPASVQPSLKPQPTAPTTNTPPPTASASPLESLIPTPVTPEFTPTIGIAFFAAASLLTAVLIKRKTKKQST